MNLKELVDFLCDIHWVSGWSETIDWLPAFVDQEFGEVPFDCAAKETALFFLEELVQWNGIVSIYVDLI